MDNHLNWLKNCIRTVRDWPRPGIDFKDIMPLVEKPTSFCPAASAMTRLADSFNPTAIAAIEARGWLFGPTMAYNLQIGNVPLRKKSKLPVVGHSEDYSLEYNEATLEIPDFNLRGHKVVIVDDVLATGGTVNAAATLIRRAGGEVAGCVFLINLSYLTQERRDKYPLLPPYTAVLEYSER